MARAALHNREKPHTNGITHGQFEDVLKKINFDLKRVNDKIVELEGRSSRQNIYFTGRNTNGVLNVAYARKTTLERQRRLLLEIQQV